MEWADSVSFSSDELTAYISSDRSGSIGDYDEWISTRAQRDATFATPTPLQSLNSAAADGRISVTADGLTAFFDSNPSGGAAAYDIYVATRASTTAEFGSPSLVSVINDTAAIDTSVDISRDGRTIYFARRHGDSLDYKLFRANRSSTEMPFGVAAEVGELNASGDAADPVLSADGLTIFFSSRRSGGQGGYDIWMAKRSTVMDGFGLPVNVQEVSSTVNDWPSWLSNDGCRLYIASDRPGGAGSHDFWVATRPL